MKLSEWLRGPVPKNDPVISWLTWAAILIFTTLEILYAK